MQPNKSTDEEQELITQPAGEAPVDTPPAPIVTLQPDDEFTQDVDFETTSIQESEPVYWQAQEYIHHDKSPVWFIFFAIIVIALIAIAIFLMDSITFAVLVPVMAFALLVYTHRPPRVLDYTLSSQGLHINDHLYAFEEFKSFGVIHDGKEYSVMLLPVKRFKPGVSVYFPEESGEAIVDMLGARLPMQELKLDLIDQLIRKMRI